MGKCGIWLAWLLAVEKARSGCDISWHCLGSCQLPPDPILSAPGAGLRRYALRFVQASSALGTLQGQLHPRGLPADLGGHYVCLPRECQPSDFVPLKLHLSLVFMCLYNCLH